MTRFLEWTAWPMIPPRPYGMFHIVFAAVGILTAFFGARILAGKSLQTRGKRRVILAAGLCLLAMEGYKQLFLYEIVGGGRYDWWYFPFQLCSLPMYLCPLMFFLGESRWGTSVGTFMMDFNLLGGLMVFLEPSGLMHPYLTLTIHGFLWHILIIFVGFYIGMSGQGDKSLSGFWRALLIYAIGAVLATLCNVAFAPFGEISMFYISPFEPSTQIVFHDIALRFGTGAGIASYVGATCLGAFLIHLAWKRCCKEKIR